MKIGNKNEALLEDLLIKILIRLPEKSLVRFRCVSKSWISLISDPYFAKLRSELYKERILIFVPGTSKIQFINFNALSLRDSSSSVVVKLDFLPPQPSWYCNRILGSCRGFLLFDCYPNICLSNPATGFHRQIPQCPTYSHFHEQMLFPFLNVHGLGYDPSTDDYLVTVMSYDPIRFSYFSFNANNWKELEGVNMPYMGDDEYGEPRLGLFFNGAIHWFARRYDRLVNVIAVFDVTERSFSEIGLPRDFDGNLNLCNLRLFGNFLSLCTIGRMWVMEEYKEQSSWVKRELSTRSSPICCTRSGDIVGIKVYNRLVKFNDKGEVQDYCDLPKGCYGKDIYTESLVSLPGSS